MYQITKLRNAINSTFQNHQYWISQRVRRKELLNGGLHCLRSMIEFQLTCHIGTRTTTTATALQCGMINITKRTSAGMPAVQANQWTLSCLIFKMSIQHGV